MKYPLLLIASAPLLLFSCAPQHPKDMAAVEELRAEFASGWKPDAQLSETAQFTEENLTLVRRAERDEPDSIQRLRLTIFRRTLTSGILFRTSRSEMKMGALAEELDFPSVRAMLEDVYGVPFAETRALAESALTCTDSLARVLGTEEPPPLPSGVGHYLESAARRGAALATFRSMGFVPDSGALQKISSGTANQFREDLTEMGASLYQSCITERALEFRFLGEATIAETFGHLIGGLAANPAWMRQHLRMPVSVLKTYARFAALDRLARIRKAAARVRAAYASAVPEDPDFWEDRFRSDPGFRELQGLRAEFIASRCDAWLRGLYGVNWYENPDAGAALRGFWSQGGRLNAEGLMHRIGEGSPRVDAWFQSVKDLLLLSSR